MKINVRLVAIFVVGVSLVLAIASSLGDAPIVDEVPHIGAGYSYVSTLDMRLNPEHPPLVKDLAGLPLLIKNIDQSVFLTKFWTSETNGQWEFGRRVIFNAGVSADTIKNLARLPVLIFFILACYFLWRWSRERYGDTAAIIALILLAFSPTIMAHARLVTTDMASATGVLVATYYFVRFLRTLTWKNFALSSLSLGLALITKFNVALLGPFFVLIGIIYALDGHWMSSKYWGKAFRTFLLTALIGTTAFVAVVWPIYVVQTWNYPPARQLADTKNITGWYSDNPIKSFAVWGADKPIIRGAAYWALGLAMVAQRSEGGNTIYWLGRVVREGGPWYFPIVYFLKEPLSWWILISMALTSLVFHRRRVHGEAKHGTYWSRNTDEWVWLLWLAMYWFISIRSTLNIGIRHLLPIYPFMIMLVAGRLSIMLGWLKTHDRIRWRWFSALIALLIGWYVFESVNVYPFYLTYFNQIAGGPSGGYRYVTDSNLDWGQDLKRLGEWVKQNNIQHISLDYFGWSDPAYYLGDHNVWTSSTQWKNAADFVRHNQSDGWIAVSATFLQNSNGEKTFTDDTTSGTYRWLMDYEPVNVIGHSIFVWHIK